MGFGYGSQDEDPGGVTQKLLIFVDANMSWRVAQLLRDFGHDAIHVDRLGSLRHADMSVWELASARRAVVFTKDKDFLTIAGAGGGARLLFYRGFNAKRAALLTELQYVLPDALRKLSLGAMVVQIP